MSDKFDRPEDHAAIGRAAPRVDGAIDRAGGTRDTGLRHMRWRVALLALSGGGAVVALICLSQGRGLLGLEIFTAVVIVLAGLVYSW